ncbi:MULTISPECIES: hypothetical protein [Xanthomonas]|uniref:hypothetical protein n=1 Tax=Xanthomonas TaxID=338 RepID=UPI001E3C1CBD|nr:MULTISPECIES: hypothetical protein [Xanthomonas]
MEGLELALALEGRTHRVNVEDEATYRVNAGTFWADITFYPGQNREVKADGLPNAQGAALVQALSVALTEKRLGENVAFLKGEQRTIDTWLDHKAEQERACSEQRRWFTHEQQADALAARAQVDPGTLRARLKKPGVAARLGTGGPGNRALVSCVGSRPPPGLGRTQRSPCGTRVGS